MRSHMLQAPSGGRESDTTATILAASFPPDGSVPWHTLPVFLTALSSTQREHVRADRRIRGQPTTSLTPAARHNAMGGPRLLSLARERSPGARVAPSDPA